MSKQNNGSHKSQGTSRPAPGLKTGARHLRNRANQPFRGRMCAGNSDGPTHMCGGNSKFPSNTASSKVACPMETRRFLRYHRVTVPTPSPHPQIPPPPRPLQPLPQRPRQPPKTAVRQTPRTAPGEHEKTLMQGAAFAREAGRGNGVAALRASGHPASGADRRREDTGLTRCPDEIGGRQDLARTMPCRGMSQYVLASCCD